MGHLHRTHTVNKATLVNHALLPAPVHLQMAPGLLFHHLSRATTPTREIREILEEDPDRDTADQSRILDGFSRREQDNTELHHLRLRRGTTPLRNRATRPPLRPLSRAHPLVNR